MGRVRGILIVALSILAWSRVFAALGYSVQIDLQQQTAYLIRGRNLVLESPISSGRNGHLTETGSFKVIEKERNHYSSIYGKIVDASGNTIVADADADMKVPRGGRFVPAPRSRYGIERCRHPSSTFSIPSTLPSSRKKSAGPPMPNEVREASGSFSRIPEMARSQARLDALRQLIAQLPDIARAH